MQASSEMKPVTGFILASMKNAAAGAATKVSVGRRWRNLPQHDDDSA
ncbi:hypothetical protein [Pantoea sp. R102]|nr:hypothetical protein [Pantoea sp. R102]